MRQRKSARELSGNRGSQWSKGVTMTTLQEKLRESIGSEIEVSESGRDVEIRLAGRLSRARMNRDEVADWLRQKAGQLLAAAELIEPEGPEVGLHIIHPGYRVAIVGENDLAVDVYNADSQEDAIRQVRSALAGAVARAKGGAK